MKLFLKIIMYTAASPLIVLRFVTMTIWDVFFGHKGLNPWQWRIDQLEEIRKKEQK